MHVCLACLPESVVEALLPECAVHKALGMLALLPPLLHANVLSA